MHDLRFAFARQCGDGLLHEAGDPIVAIRGGPGTAFPAARFEREEAIEGRAQRCRGTRCDAGDTAKLIQPLALAAELLALFSIECACEVSVPLIARSQ